MALREGGRIGCTAAVEALPLLAEDVPPVEPHLPQFRIGLCIDAVYHLPPDLVAIGRLRSGELLVAGAGHPEFPHDH